MSAGIATVLVGASGRMGQQILQNWRHCPQLTLIGAVASAGSRALGTSLQPDPQAPAVSVSAELAPLLPRAQLVIDFSTASAAAATLAACVGARVPLLLGTTGLPASLEGALAAASAQIALLVAANTSRGVNLLLELARRAAAGLGAGYDIEIVEAHHRHKVDAPSGTALALGQAAAAGRQVNLSEVARYDRHGLTGPRKPGEIGFAVLRGGDVVGEHEIRFLGDGENITLRHCVTDRAVFARGALEAGAWLAGQAPGRYAMRDVFSS